MELFPERLVQQTLRMPGATHSYLKHLCLPEAEGVRRGVESVVQRQPSELAERWTEMLLSLDNRRFFQAFAELGCVASLEVAGWKPLGYRGGYVEVQHPARGTFNLAVLALLQQRRPGGEEALHARLMDGLGRISARHRFAVLIRRWLPPDLDPEPVRRALELWLAQVAHGQWEGRYATYEDERLSLEFCLTGEATSPGQSPLAFCMGPFHGHRTMEALEPRAIAELDRYASSGNRRVPMLLAFVTDQSWLMNDGYLLDFLYGRPDAIRVEDGVHHDYSGGNAVCVFRDPLYPFVSGVWLMDRQPTLSLEQMRLRVCLNPWAGQPLTANDVAFRCFAEDSRAGTLRSMRWFPGLGNKLVVE